MDILRIAWLVNSVALAFVFLTAILLAWNNVSSRTLVLATGTLFAAMLLFVIQTWFELQQTRERYFVNAELTIDRSKPWVTDGCLPDRQRTHCNHLQFFYRPFHLWLHCRCDQVTFPFPRKITRVSPRLSERPLLAVSGPSGNLRKVNVFAPTPLASPKSPPRVGRAINGNGPIFEG